MQERYYLSDKGIRQAIEQNVLSFTPSLSPQQIQPASVDLHLEYIDDLFPLPVLLPMFSSSKFVLPSQGIIPAGFEATLAMTQGMRCSRALNSTTELRSSLRRISCHTPSGITMLAGKNCLGVELHNSGPIDIHVSRGDKIAQLLFFFSPTFEHSMHNAGFEGYEYGAVAYEQLLTLDHGVMIQTSNEARMLLRDGYFSVSPNVRFEKGMLRVHAGKTAQVLRKNIALTFSAKQDITSFFETVTLPYTVRSGEHVVVDTKESLNLSKHIGLHFYDYLNGTSRGFSFSRTPQQQLLADIPLSSIPDGWIDPGYTGVFSRQPKTYSKEGVTIREGDVLGHGMIIYFPNGVERPYGSQELGSHYQNAKTTQMMQ